LRFNKQYTFICINKTTGEIYKFNHFTELININRETVNADNIHQGWHQQNWRLWMIISVAFHLIHTAGSKP